MSVYHYTEFPSITSLTYDGGNRAIYCISTGSPATRVTWMKDGQPLTADGSSPYSFSQTITNRSISTYSNVLSISERVQRVTGTYTCIVSNDLGSDSMELVAVGELGLQKVHNCNLVPLPSLAVCACVYCLCVVVYVDTLVIWMCECVAACLKV